MRYVVAVVVAMALACGGSDAPRVGGLSSECVVKAVSVPQSPAGSWSCSYSDVHGALVAWCDLNPNDSTTVCTTQAGASVANDLSAVTWCEGAKTDAPAACVR